MTAHFTACPDPELEARVTGSREMLYADGASPDDDRPPHVLAASGLSQFRERLAVIQDDANWLALIDADQTVSAVPLPPGPDGSRVFTKSRGNQEQKYDFEACITVPGENGLELIGFASCSSPDRVWVLRVCEKREGESRFDAEFLKAERFYAMLRARTDFCGAGLNIEGAVTLDEDRIMLFQRGNADAAEGLEPCDATAEISWRELRAYLADPDAAPVPELREVRTYDLGELDGVRLTFSDAEHLGEGRILYSASAEKHDSGEVTGSILGVLEADGRARWNRLLDQDGQPFTGKIEGLTRDVHERGKVHFVIDDDDDAVPSKIYQAELSRRYFEPA